MKRPLLIFELNCLSSNPGVTCFLSLLKNSFKNKTLKLLTTFPEEWVEIPLVEKTSSSGLLLDLNDVIPLNPLTHPVKEFVVIPVYVIISESIWIKP